MNKLKEEIFESINLFKFNDDIKRFGNPEELVGTLIWLLSDASLFVSGEVICVDGGFHIFSGV